MSENTSTSESFEIGGLVWAKMKGFPPWPGRISEPPADLKKPAGKKAIHCIYFFGSKNYAWIEEVHLKDYATYKESLTKSNKSQAFRDAVSAIEYYMEHKKEGVNGVEDPEDIFEKVKNAVTEPKPKKKSTTKRDASTSNGEVNDVDAKPDKIPKLTVKKEKPSPKVVNHETQSPSATSNQTAYQMSYGRKYQALLDRPSSLPQQEVAPIDVTTISSAVRERNISPSKLKFGFLGLGNIGSGIVKNLLNSGHNVTIWNRSPDKCKEFVKVGAEIGMTPSDVIQGADITFSCVANPQAAKEMVFGNCGVLSEMMPTKCYVEMTGIDADTSQDIGDAITAKGGRYLEAQIQGNKIDAEEGTLVILAAGDKTLFDECQSCFIAMSKNSFYLGEVGNASKMNLVLQLMHGITLAGLAEGLALADRAGLQQKDVLEILQLTPYSCPAIIEKGNSMIQNSFGARMPLQHMQKDMKLSIMLGDQVEQPLPLTATVNEVYKHAKRLGYGEYDDSAVYIRARF